MIAASIWLIFLVGDSVGFASFDSLASRLATVAVLVVGLSVCTLVAFFALRTVVLALVDLVLVVIVWSPVVRMGWLPSSGPANHRRTTPAGVSALVRDLPSAFGAVAQLLAFDDVEHRIVVYVAFVFRVICVNRIVDLFSRADARDRVFKGPILLPGLSQVLNNVRAHRPDRVFLSAGPACG
jgi:hypothetical protein